jgi:hypothetical protein
MDPDPGSGSRIQQKTNFNTIFSACYFLKVHLHYFSKIKSQKESENSRIQGFLIRYFCMMIEGSGPGSRAGSGSIPLTSGSGSGRPKTRGSGGSGFGSASGTLIKSLEFEIHVLMGSF